MFAAIYIPDFPVEAIVRLKPELRERAVAVVEGTPPLVRVLAVNERASDAGLEPGMTKLQAEEHIAACNGVLAARSPEQEASAQAALLDAACGFSPRVEDTAPGLIVLDLDGLERIFGPVAKMARDIARRCSEIGLEAQIAVAANPDAAIHVARGFSGVTVIPEGREAERLATLPVDVLVSPASLSRGDADGATPAKQLSKNSRALTLAGQELLNTLESWGVRNLRSLAALPEVAVAERLGQAGLHWQRLARGVTSRTLKLIEPPARFEETCELEYPVESLEPLSFLLNRMLEQLCARLSARALATNELRTTLTLDPAGDVDTADFHVSRSPGVQISRAPDRQFTRCLRLPVPMLDPKVFLKLLQLDLQAHLPGAPVLKISIEAHPAEPRRTQNGLFQPGTPEPEKLEVTLARIQSMIDGRRSTALEDDRKPTTDDLPFTSELRVGTAELLDTHHPDSFRVHPFMTPSTIGHPPSTPSHTVTALRLFRPAPAARVALRTGKPVHIECETVQGDILWTAGPWKSSGDWWNEKSWAREEWDVCVGEACYRIYRDPKGWFVEGTYD